MKMLEDEWWSEVGLMIFLLWWMFFSEPVWVLPASIFVLLTIMHVLLAIRYIYLFIKRHRHK
jgi:hypothetical protein